MKDINDQTEAIDNSLKITLTGKQLEDLAELIYNKLSKE